METDYRKTHKVQRIYPLKGFASLKAKAGIGRNEPCPCGSGKKVKNCCTHLLKTEHMSIRPQKVLSDEERKCKVDGVPYKSGKLKKRYVEKK